MKNTALITFICLLVCAVSSCVSNVSEHEETSCDYAQYFDLISIGDQAESKAVVVISPYDNSRDTLLIDEPYDNIVCMSSSQVAGIAEIGADSLISAVSGLKYITNPNLRSRALDEKHPVYDIGYEVSLDYERILNLKPDVLLTYTVSGAEPQYISKLRSLGVNVLVLHDHLENHPLARAEYLKLYGTLVGREAFADSVFTEICNRYETLSGNVPVSAQKAKVLMNLPYGDAWYIPGGDSYMARIILDAGGEVLGAKAGTSVSGVISMEEAYQLSMQADLWLNPGSCRTRAQLASFHHTFRFFGPIANGLPVYNNTLRITPEGGNDFWESGSVRPDLILEDLVTIFSDVIARSQSNPGNLLKYHFEVK